jgi:predicted PurR-regulated permease PerM
MARRVPGDAESTWARAKPLFLAAFLTIMTIVGLKLIVELRGLLILIFLSMVLAAAMSRPAAVLERRGIPRGIAVAVVQLAALAALLAAGYLVLPPLLDEVAGFAHRVPHYIDRFKGLRRSYQKLRASYPELGTFDGEVSQLADRLGSVAGKRLINLPLGIADLLYEALTVVAISTLLVMRRERIVQAFMPLVAPHRREHTAAIIDTIWDPQIGPWIGRIPLLAVAAFEGPETLALTFLASFILENLKAYVISPHVEGEQLKLDPLLVLLAVLAGATLLGAAGAIVAVPFAAMLQVLYDEIFLPWREAQIEGDD